MLHWKISPYDKYNNEKAKNENTMISHVQYSKLDM